MIKQEITAKIKKIIYFNAENNFSILALESKDKQKIVAKGNVGELRENQTITIKGYWVNHKKYGKQFQIEELQVPELDSTEELLVFFETGMIKGVNRKLGQRIIDMFGDEAIDILNNNPEKLLQVKGIGKKNLEKIIASWRAESEKRSVIVFFHKWGITVNMANKIFKKIPDPPTALQTIKENPYWLVWNVHGIGFLTADKIAQKSGLAIDSPERIKAGIYFVLQEALSKQGHCYLPQNTLIEKASELLNLKGELVEKQIFELLKSEDLIKTEEGNIYLAMAYYTEQKLAKNIAELLKKQPAEKHIYDIDGMIEDYCEVNNINLHINQKKAIKTAIENNFSIITGGPGTGKTTVVKAILTIASQLGINLNLVDLVAPTGRASKRLEESTGLPARTIHRLLGYKPEEGFTVNEKNPLKSKMLICDESSMIDVFLANALFSAIPKDKDYKIVFVGDIYQLPSVGAGNVLHDLIKAKVPVAELTKVFRQSEGSYISLNAQHIKNGDSKSMNFNADDFKFLFMKYKTENKAKEIQETIIEILDKLLQKYTINDIQILSPMYNGDVGVNALNSVLQDYCNPNKVILNLGSRKFKLGDKVIQLKNNYDKEVFNGDVGYITKYDKDEENVFVQFDDNKLVEYSLTDLQEIALAYAITIHKSQGSEYPVVIMPLTTAHFIMLQRNLVYTGITRAKQECFLVGDRQALELAIKNNKPIHRNTSLDNYILHYVKNSNSLHPEKMVNLQISL